MCLYFRHVVCINCFSTSRFIKRKPSTSRKCHSCRYITRVVGVHISYIIRIAHWSCAYTSYRCLQILIQAGESYRWSPGAVAIYTQSQTHDHFTHCWIFSVMYIFPSQPHSLIFQRLDEYGPRYIRTSLLPEPALEPTEDVIVGSLIPGCWLPH